MRSCLLRPPEDRSMSNPRAHEVLYESEAALRLVDQELSGMHDARDAAPPPAPTISLSDLPNILEQANAQIRFIRRCMDFLFRRARHRFYHHVGIL